MNTNIQSVKPSQCKSFFLLFLAATSSSRNTPWLLLLFFFLFLGIMMMLPLIINSYNLVTFHQNLMKLVSNWRTSPRLSFPGNIFQFFPFLFEISDLSGLVDLEKIQRDSIRVNFRSPKSSSFMHGLSPNLLEMIKQKELNDSQGINFWISFYFFQKLDLSLFVDLKKISALIA